MEDSQNVTFELLEAITIGAEKYKDDTDPENLLNQAVDSWYQINMSLTVAHPTRQHTGRFIREVIETALENTVKKLVTSKREITTVTLMFATQELIDCLINVYGWSALTPYQIPLEIMVAVFYLELIKIIADKYKES